MIELLVWRHAKTEPGAAGQSDRDRHLVRDGRLDAQRVGRYLVEHDLVPDVILCSDAMRARETADLAENEFARATARFDLSELYNADDDAYLPAIEVYAPAAKRVLLVAHNPAVEEFVTRIAGNATRMRPGSIAIVSYKAADFTGARSVAGTLSEIYSPRG